MNAQIYVKLVVMIFLLITFPFTHALTISDIESQPRSESATIRFKTSQVATAVMNVSNGTSEQIVSSPSRTNHVVDILNLQPSTQYTYYIEVFGVGNATNAHSSRLTFTTWPQDVDRLFVHADIPQYANGNIRNLVISTVPDALVEISVDGDVRGVGVADSAGIYTMTRLPLNTQQASNVVQITVEHEDFAGTQILEEVVVIDMQAPVLSVDRFLSVSTDGNVVVKGTVDKVGTLSVYTQSEFGAREEVYTADIESSEFSHTVSLEDGLHDVFVEFTDQAGNRASHTQRVFVDTEPLVILEHNLNDLSPTYSSIIQVKGRVNKPRSLVRIYIDPSQEPFNLCRDVLAVNDEERDFLQEMCVDGFGDGSANNARYVTVRADSDGYFEREINLYQPYAMYIRQDEADVSLEGEEHRHEESVQVGSTVAVGTSGAQSRLDVVSSQGKTHTLRIVAIDRVGQYESTSDVPITYTVCGVGGDWGIIQGNIYPAIIKPDLVFRGQAQFSFQLDFDYFGAHPSSQITRVNIRERATSVAEKERLNTGVFDPSRCTVYPRSWPSIDRIGSQGTRNTAHAYVVCRLNQYPPQSRQNITEGYKTLEDMQFAGAPLLIEVLYDYIDADGEKRSKSQQVCYDAKIYFDRRLPPGAIPEDFLNASVQVLDATIEAIDAILKPLRTITLATTGACLATHVGYFLQTSQMEYQCLGKQELIPALRQGISGVPHSQADNMINAICDEVDEAKRQKEAGAGDYNKGLGDLRLSEITGDCRACGQAIKRNVQIQKYFTTVCDRIYCPPTPSGQKYVRDNRDNPFSACSALHTQAAVDEFSQRSKSPQSEFLGIQTGFNKDDGCGYEYYSQYGSSCLGYRLLAGHDIVQASINNAQQNHSPSFNTILDRATNFDFCAANEAKEDIAFSEGDQWYIRDEDDPNCFRLGGPEAREAVITSRQRGVAYLNASSETRGIGIFRDVKGYNETTSQTYSDCVRTDPQGNLYFVPRDTSGGQQGGPAYFDRNARATVNKTFQNQQIEVQDIGDGRFIGPDDTIYQVDDGQAQIYEGSRIYQTNAAVGSGIDYHLGKPDGYDDGEMQIAQGPDRLRGRPAPEYLIRAPTSFMNSLRCGCLPALSSYLQQIRNILNLIRTCFQGILVTKEFNSGMCRAVLTQYVCDWIFEALGCFIRAASMSDDQLAADTGRTNAVQYGLTSIGRASRTTQQYASGRYGDSQNFQALFTQRKLLNAICLAALGYDWLPDLEAAIGMDGQFPVETMAVVQPASRVYLSANPTQGGLTTFNYHIGYLVNAGEDINYRIELLCSAQPTCDHLASHEGGMCDCAHGSSGNVQTAPGNWGADGGGFNTEQSRVIRTGFVRAGQLEDDEIYINVESPVRYDRVRISWFPANSQNPPGSEERRIRETGMTPLTCSFDLVRLQFRCGTTFGEDGSAHFTRPSAVDGIGIYRLGDNLRFTTFIHLVDGQGLNALPHYLRIEVRDHQNNLIYSGVTSKNELQNGTQSYPREPIKLQRSQQQSRRVTISNPSSNALLVSPPSQKIVPATFYEFAHITFNASRTGQGKHPCEVLDENRDRLTSCAVNLNEHTVRIKGETFRINNQIQENSNILYTSNITTQTASGTGLACPPGQSTVEWKATLSLHGSRVRDVGRDITWENSVMNEQVLSFNGNPQEQTVSFEMECDQSAPDRPVTNTCAYNELLTGTCNCGGFNCHRDQVCSRADICYEVDNTFLQYVDASTVVKNEKINNQDGDSMINPDKLIPLKEDQSNILAAYCGGIPIGTQLGVICFEGEQCLQNGQNYWCRNEPSN